MEGPRGITPWPRLYGCETPKPIIVLASFSDDDKVVAAIKAGALSYLVKSVAPADLVKAIQAAHRRTPRGEDLASER